MKNKVLGPMSYKNVQSNWINLKNEYISMIACFYSILTFL